MIKKSFSTIAITLSAFLMGLTSCDIGLGNAIDLEAPVLEITSPGNNAFVAKKFAISGIAKDNTKTEEIRFVYSYSITDPVTGLPKKQGPFTRTWTDIDSNGAFSCPFDEFAEDTEIYFEITAFDKNRNGSEFSSSSITVILDTSDIDVKEPRIKRDGYVARLLPISEFTDSDGRTAKRESTENKDYFQNKSFSLLTNVTARYGVKSAKLSLYEVDERGNKIGGPFIANRAPDASANAYAPEFSFTSADMTTAKDSLKTGLHYILPELVVVGNAGQVTTICQNVFAWEEEYDIPHARFSSMQGSVVKVPTQGNIPVSVFDDDGISAISYAVVKNTDFTNITSVPSASFTSVNDFTPGLRDHTFGITAPAQDANYKLVMKIIDSTANNATYLKAIDLQVTNGEAPTIIVRTPEENSVPVLTNGKFSISASIIDNSAVSDIAVAWLPEGNNDIDKFTEYFNKTYDFSGNATFAGSVIHKLTVQGSPVYDSTTHRYTSNVSNQWDFFTDFIKNGTVDNSNKVFMFAARDNTENITTQTFRLNRFTSKPSFKIEYKQTGDATWKTVDNPLITLSVKITEIRITPVAQNNMSITACNATSKNNPQDPSESTGFTISQQWSAANPLLIKLTGESPSSAPASGKNFNITLTATDQLNNSAGSKLTVAFDTLGNLTQIIATKEDNHTYTLNDEIVLQADFDNRVAIYPASGKLPYIEFNSTGFKNKDGTAVTAEKRRAVYDTNRNKNSSSNTFYFTYKIADEVECSQLAIPADNPINLNGATVEGTFTKTGAGTDFNNKKLKIDSIKPYLVKSSFVPAPDSVIQKTDGQITIKLKFNEKVNITSGSLVLKRTAGWYIPPVLSKEVFEDKIFLPSKAADRITVCGDATKPFKYGKDKNGIDTIIAEGPYMQYTNGLKIPVTDTADVTPDLTTKYVLNYKYAIKELPNPDNSTEIEAHNAVVKNLRKVLENCGYHMATFDVQELSGNGTDTLSLTVKDSDFIDCLVNGVEYTLTLSDNSVRDDAYNYMDTGLAENDYKFLVGPVATPVIRVNRIATNGTNDQTCKTTKAKIDCVTPSVKMSYIIDPTRTGTMSNSTTKDAFVQTTTKNITASALKGLASTTTGVTANTITTFDGTQELSETLGADNYTTNAKIYIKATAEKTGFSNSLSGYEGAFKTVLRVYTQSSCNNVKDSKGQYCFAVFGSQIPEANSYTAGWPLSQNEPIYQKFQVAYKNGSNYYWSSWQILDNYCLQTLSSSYLNPAKTNVGFGQAILIYNPAIYGYTN
ncbi:MAG: hypothetical protein MJ169_06615 [Treponema sp.]|nr:hypothetical protein [Treponema sp.]